MNFIVKNIKWVMLASGILTLSMFYGLFAPQAAVENTFGASIDGQLAMLIVRSWCALVGLMGAMLVYGALNEKHRVFAISIASLSKATFVTLVILYGSEYLAKAAPAIILDSVVVLLAAIYLSSVHLGRPAAQQVAAGDL